MSEVFISYISVSFVTFSRNNEHCNVTLTFIKQTEALTSIQKGLYVFVFPEGRKVQVMSQGIHGILKKTEKTKKKIS